MCSLRNNVAALVLLSACFFARAQEPDTVATFNLDRSVITEETKKPIILNSRGISGQVNTDEIAKIPSILGTPDPIRFVRLLPSVQLNTEVDGGLYMQGSEHSHTLISQEGVPIYGTGHMLGFFSTFNSPHYSGMKYATSCGQEARIGGLIDMQLADTVARKLSTDVSIGLLSAQGTVDIPLGKSSLKISARRTYIDLLFGGMLRYEDNAMTYNFTDANITWTWKPTRKDRITVDLFGALDHGMFTGVGLFENMDGKWYNALGAVHWNHYFTEASLKQTVYYTTAGLDPWIRAFGVYARMQSYIMDAGYRAKLHWKNWDFGARFSSYFTQPQNPYTEGHFNDARNNGSIPKENGFAAAVNAEYTRGIGYWLSVKAGIGADWYLSPQRKSYWGITPEVSLMANFMEGGKLDFTYGIKRQNLFQTGLTSSGLPSEFWTLAGDLQAPQWAHCFSLAYNNSFLDGMLSVSAEVYYKQLHNQLEYVGSLMDMYTGDYSLESSTLKGDGRAYGFNFMFQKTKGRFTGWISYALSRSLRTFVNDWHSFEFTSAHERRHEIDIVATYDFGRFDVGATFVAASGTPYTRPTSFYVVGSRMVCTYGPYNAETLPAYAKMDLSANWYIRKGPKLTHGVNVSMYNVLGRVNAVGYGLHFNRQDQTYSFRANKIQIRFMPSAGYFLRF